MKIAIVGAGLAGASMAYMLTKFGPDSMEVDLYGNKPDGCKCAWGSTREEYLDAAATVSFDPQKYIIGECDVLQIYGPTEQTEPLLLPKGAFLTFDKAGLVRDLVNEAMELSGGALQGLFVGGDVFQGYDLIIDASGHERVVMGHQLRDYTPRVIECVQRRYAKDALGGVWNNVVLVYLGEYGYSWLFPLGERGWHLGAGDINTPSRPMAANPETYIDLLIEKAGIENIYDTMSPSKPACECTAPRVMLDPLFIKDKKYVVNRLAANRTRIVAIGEAAGLVTVGGEGNVQAMWSASSLFDQIEHYSARGFSLDRALDTYYRSLEPQYPFARKSYKFLDAYLQGHKGRMLWYGRTMQGRWGRLGLTKNQRKQFGGVFVDAVKSQKRLRKEMAH